MTGKLIKFDNNYDVDLQYNVIHDPNGYTIADLAYTVNKLNLNLLEMEDLEIWALCKPIILAHEAGIKQTQDKMTKKLLKLFDLKEETNE